jgi:hypothetical protein
MSSSQQQYNQNFNNGYNGGGTDTNGMSSQQKQQTDKAVNDGKKAANR